MKFIRFFFFKGTHVFFRTSQRVFWGPLCYCNHDWLGARSFGDLGVEQWPVGAPEKLMPGRWSFPLRQFRPTFKGRTVSFREGRGMKSYDKTYIMMTICHEIRILSSTNQDEFPPNLSQGFFTLPLRATWAGEFFEFWLGSRTTSQLYNYIYICIYKVGPFSSCKYGELTPISRVK